MNSTEVASQARTAHKHFLSDRMRINYYCQSRKKHFTNMVKVDFDLEIQRKINGLKFTLICPEVRGAGNPSLVIATIDGHHPANVGDPVSIPAYLFGPDYYFARRKNSADNFDFRKSAFEPIPGAATRFAEKFYK